MGISSSKSSLCQSFEHEAEWIGNQSHKFKAALFSLSSEPFCIWQWDFDLAVDWNWESPATLPTPQLFAPSCAPAHLSPSPSIPSCQLPQPEASLSSSPLCALELQQGDCCSGSDWLTTGSKEIRLLLGGGSISLCSLSLREELLSLLWSFSLGYLWMHIEMGDMPGRVGGTAGNFPWVPHNSVV